MPKLTEGDIKIVVNEALKDKGWILSGEGKNIWTEDRSQGNPADYVCYDKNQKPLIIIEVKRQGKDLKQALEQGIGYAKTFKAPLVIATDSVFTKCFHVNYQKSLTLDGEDFEDLLSEEQALKFVEQPHLITKEDKKILSRNELIKVFEEVNELLRHDVLQAGDERFSEFANLLFLKIFSEIEEKKLKNNELITIDREDLWSSFSQRRGKDLWKYVNDTVLKNFKKKYENENLFIDSQIQDPQILEKIIDKLSPLSLHDTPTDVKGEAFEHFLKKYNSGKKDLGEYFTPRHIVKLLVFLVKPRFKEKIYDPFCGTGGILIEAFKSISEGVVTDDKQNKEVLGNSIRGNEKTKIARIAKMNMILFGDGHNNIAQINTFQCPLSSVASQFEAVITNIPFGFDNVDYGKNKYPIGCKYGDCLAIQHCLKACKDNGKVVIIMPEGFFNQRTKKGYRLTKKWIIENYSIQAVISLPKGAFSPYTNSKSSIVAIEKKKKSRNYFYYYQIKNDGFTLDAYRNKIEGVVNDIENLYALWEEVVIEEKESSPLFTKVYYQDIGNDKYDLLAKPLDFPLSKIQENKNYIPLSQIADIWRGCFELKKEEFIDNGFAKVYQSSHATNDDFSLRNRYITEERYQELKKYELQTDDIIMSFSGTYLGKVALFPKTAEKGIAWSMGIVVIRIKTEWREKILPEYLLSICRTPQIKKFLLDRTFGTTIQNLRVDILEKFPIPVPPLEEQQKAIKELNNIRQMIKNSEENTKTLKSSLSLSLSYEVKKIRDICLINPSKSEIRDKKNIEVSYLLVEDLEICQLYVKSTNSKKIEEVRQSYTYFAENDLLLPKIKPSFENGKMSIAKNLVNGIGFGSTEFIVLRAKQGIKIEWVYYCLRNSDFIEKGKTVMTGTAQQRIRIDFMENYSIPLPPLEIQEKFVKELEEEQQIIDYQQKSIDLLKRKYQKFLDNLW